MVTQLCKPALILAKGLSIEKRHVLPVPIFYKFRVWTAHSYPLHIKLHSETSTLKLGHTPLSAFVVLPFFELDPVSALHCILLPRPSCRPQAVPQLCLHLSFRAGIFIEGFPGLAEHCQGPYFLYPALNIASHLS